jgi:hypothetical protein
MRTVLITLTEMMLLPADYLVSQFALVVFSLSPTFPLPFIYVPHYESSRPPAGN